MTSTSARPIGADATVGVWVHSGPADADLNDADTRADERFDLVSRTHHAAFTEHAPGGCIPWVQLLDSARLCPTGSDSRR